jgi:hypothetical protein
VPLILQLPSRASQKLDSLQLNLALTTEPPLHLFAVFARPIFEAPKAEPSEGALKSFVNF